MFPDMHKLVPAGKRGVAEVRHRTLTQKECWWENAMGDPIRPGTYAVLRVNDQIMMSDTPAERISNKWAVLKARGRVLLAGLGIGMLAHAILKKDTVTELVIIEKELDVITLITPTLPKDPRLSVVYSDIFTWMPPEGMKFDTIYFDIWADASMGRATKDKRRLAGRFRKYKTAGGWLGSWSPLSI
jgi:spermidine synthase